jgi:polysaccharide biosynthesis/export protein
VNIRTLFVSLLCCAAVGLAQPSLSKRMAGYILGPEDVITVRVLEIEEFNSQNLGAIGVDPQGNIRLPLAGRIHVAGLSVEQLEAKIAQALTSVMNDPEVTVTVTAFGSSPVSVLGAVRNPGVHQISGHKTLFEVLSLAGGLSPDAGNAIKITRHVDAGPLPLAGVTRDSGGGFFVGGLNVRSVMEAKDPSVNIEVLANDVITVPKAELVYVIGAVKRPGGFVLNEREHMSVLQALSLAEGLDRVAAGKAARILRQDEAGGNRSEIPINVRSILEGKTQDVALHANDILFVPDSAAKGATMRALEAAVQMGTGVVIWRR